MREIYSWLWGLLDNGSLRLGTALVQWGIVQRSAGAGGAQTELSSPLLRWLNCGWDIFQLVQGGAASLLFCSISGWILVHN